MAVVFTGRFPVLEDTELPTDMKDKITTDWHDSLKRKREKILENLTTRIPDEDTYKKVIADVGYSRIIEVFNPNYPKYKRILRKYRAKTYKGADDWIKNVPEAFKEGGRFEEGIYANIDKYKDNMGMIWRFVGDKDKIFGPVPKAILALAGKAKALENVIMDIDTVSGSPVPVFKPEHESRVLPVVDNILIEALNVIMLSREAGLDISGLISDYNALLDAYVKNATFARDNIDTANTFCHIAYDDVTGRIVVDVQIATV